MPYKLGSRSLQNLSGVNPDMVAVVKRAIEPEVASDSSCWTWFAGNT